MASYLKPCAGSCHGTTGADYYLTCGTTEDQRRANYLMTRAFVAGTTADSELLVRPLDPTRGGDQIEPEDRC